MLNLKDKVGYSWTISELLWKVFWNKKIESYKIAECWYQSLNIIVSFFDEKKVFLKVFPKEFDQNNCQGYVDLIEFIRKNGIKHPKLYDSNTWKLWIIESHWEKVFYILQQFIPEKSLFESKKELSEEQIRKLVFQLSLINSLEFKPKYSDDDTWACIRFNEQFEIKKDYLSKDEVKLLKPILKEFNEIDFSQLPCSLVHSDIIGTNVIFHQDEFFILDFWVCSFQPRIIELATLFHDILYFPWDKEKTFKFRQIVLDEYQKKLVLTNYEKQVLPILSKVVHAMFLMWASYTKNFYKENSPETQYWYEKSLSALKEWI